MVHKNIGRLRLQLYAGVDELPAERYNKFNIYCMLRSGIGNDAESILSHIQDLTASVNKKDFGRAATQLQNYHHALSMILNHEDLQSMAFACLVHSINEEEVKDISEEGLRRVVGRVARAEKRLQAMQIFGLLKKKIENEMEECFPERVNDTKVAMFYNFMRKHSRLLNRKVLGQDVDAEISEVENEFYKRSEPVLYGGPDGILLKMERSFETNCIVLQQRGMQNPKTASIFEFYQSIELLNKQDDGRQKRTSKRK